LRSRQRAGLRPDPVPRLPRSTPAAGAFAEGTVERVQVLAYGDDPDVEPGQAAVRVLLSRGGRPEGPEADKEIVKTFSQTKAAMRPSSG
jgi:hypothetical protein